MSHRSHRVSTNWSPELAYCIGIITTDGNLSSDGRHLNVTSKDLDIVLNIKTLLQLSNKVGKKARQKNTERKYFFLQFGDINLYEFLLSIGLTPAKSKTLSEILVPDQYFADFLRGCIDGDGSIGSASHPESQHPQWRIRLCSASPNFLKWVLLTLQRLGIAAGGTIYTPPSSSTSTLSFGMSDTRKILSFIYYKDQLPALKRKHLIAQGCLSGRVA